MRQVRRELGLAAESRRAAERRRRLGFLGSGPAPVIITFGSTPASQAASQAAVTAARQAGQRVIIQDPATDEPSGDGGVLRSGPIPHAWLFLQAAAVVHHAGAGTTAAGLRAGIPAVTVPAYTDQPFWASRLSALGAGPAPVPRRRMTTGRLTAAIAAAVNIPDYLRNARQIAGQLAREDSATGILSELEHTGKIP
jgi:sterol 3beta-glucosyltransferase